MTTRFLVSVILIFLAIFIPTQILGISAGADSFSGTYTSELLPKASASTPARQYTLTLYTDNKAELKTDFVKGKEDFVETGTWNNNDNNTLTVTIQGGADRTYDAPVILTLAPSEGTLLVVDSYSLFLPQNFVFRR